jgi:hypothetical protein
MPDNIIPFPQPKPKGLVRKRQGETLTERATRLLDERERPADPHTLDGPEAA